MKNKIALTLFLLLSAGAVNAEELRCTGLDCMKVPTGEPVYLLTDLQLAASTGVRCAAECNDGSDVHGTFRDPIAGILGLTQMCRAKRGLKEGTVDCSD